ncbi:MAG: MBL fold metallo-hydrolase [Dehalococcoidia bacterium]|nr:MBL fold metallo-hydrolase [Dehalococcoidia bacterium]
MADRQITVGGVRITGVSDAGFDHHFPLDQLFPSVSAEVWEDYLRRYPGAFSGPKVWRVNVGCFLLQSRGRNILVDTGIGAAGGTVALSLKTPQGGRLIEKLQALGVSPQAVNTVLITHPHRDHVGGTIQGNGDQTRLAFPNARYVFSRADWDTFQRPDVQAAMPDGYVAEAVTPLERLGCLDLIDGEQPITDEVTAIPTPGHTPGHTCVLISSRGQAAIILGDSVVNPVQITDPTCVFRFDMDAAAAGRTRSTLLERIEAGGMIAIGGHFPAPGFGKLVREDGRRLWQAI